jgi:hypothetical protein
MVKKPWNRFHRPFLANPEQSRHALIDRTDQREVLVTFGVLWALGKSNPLT